MQKNKYQHIIQKINYLSCLLFIFWLPLSDNHLPPILALWILTWLMLGNFKQRVKDFSHKKLFIGLVIFFSFSIFNLVRVNDLEYGWYIIQHKLSIAFFPVFLVGSSSIIIKNYKTVLWIFILGNLVALLYCTGNSLINSFVEIDGIKQFMPHMNIYYHDQGYSFWETFHLRYNQFTYSYFSIFKHPSYFAMYLNFAIFSIIYLFKKKEINRIIIKISGIVLILLFIFTIYILQSRSGIITLVATLCIFPIIEISSYVAKRYLTIIGIISVIVFGVLIMSNQRIQNSIYGVYEFFSDKNKANLVKAELRLQLWYTSATVAKENLWIGTSAANLTDELVEKYKKLGFEGAATEELNAHNQYLESFAGLGILGLLSLLFIMGYSFYISIKEKHYLLFFLMLILSINFLFESMLNRMAGVLFMMFFLSLFVFMKKPKDEIEQKETDNSLIIE